MGYLIKRYFFFLPASGKLGKTHILILKIPDLWTFFIALFVASLLEEPLHWEKVVASGFFYSKA